MAAITRRALLSRSLLVAAVGGGALAGLTKSVSHRVAIPPPAPPQALTSALRRQQALLDGYHRTVSAGGAETQLLRGLQADVEEHGAALRALLERYPGWRLADADRTSSTTAGAATSAGPAASPAVPPTMRGLAAASTSAASELRASALSWPTTEADAAQVVPVLASMSAALSTHAQVLA